MKSVLGPLFIALVLAALGGAFWIAGQTERRLADVHQQLATLHYDEALAADNDVEASLGLIRRLPRVGEEIAADARHERATAQYWGADYVGLEPKRDAAGTLTETDPHVVLVAANAEFRATERTNDRGETLRRLDRVVKTYGDVLKSNPDADASYNFEYVVRLRETAQRIRQAPVRADSARMGDRAAADITSDLPSGPTLHGSPGAPPKGTDMSQFKIVIPKRGEERKDNPEAGKGGAKVRKG